MQEGLIDRAACSAGDPGDAHITTTAIYTDAVGEEEQSIAARMW